MLDVLWYLLMTRKPFQKVNCRIQFYIWLSHLDVIKHLYLASLTYNVLSLNVCPKEVGGWPLMSICPLNQNFVISNVSRDFFFLLLWYSSVFIVHNKFIYYVIEQNICKPIEKIGLMQVTTSLIPGS